MVVRFMNNTWSQVYRLCMCLNLRVEDGGSLHLWHFKLDFSVMMVFEKGTKRPLSSSRQKGALQSEWV